MFAVCVQDGCVADTQLKDFDSLATDLRVTVRKVRRRIPNESSGKTLQLPDDIMEDILKCANTLDAVRESMVQFKGSVGKKGNVLSEGELLQSTVVEELFQQASSACLTLVKTASPAADKMRASFEWIIATLNTFANTVQNGSYDQNRPKAPVGVHTLQQGFVYGVCTCCPAVITTTFNRSHLVSPPCWYPTPPPYIVPHTTTLHSTPHHHPA